MFAPRRTLDLYSAERRAPALELPTPVPVRVPRTLLLLDGADSLGHGLESAPGDGFPTVVRETVGSLLYLLQRALYVLKTAFHLLLDGCVHLAGEQ